MIWKVGAYFPSMLALRHPPGSLCVRLKALQQLPPAEPIVCAPPCEGHCPAPGCAGTLLVKPAMVASGHARNLPSCMSEAHGAPDMRFKFYALNAGVQHASFAESVCKTCRRPFWAPGPTAGMMRPQARALMAECLF